jgi:hypothetical protein
MESLRKVISMHKYLFLCLVILALSLSACGTAAPTTPAASQPTTKLAPTQKPATNVLSATSGATLLGSPLSNFIGSYGQPNDHTNAKNGDYHFKRWAGSNIDFLIINTDLFDPGYTNKIETIGVQSSDNPDTQPIAKAMCASFMPTDAQYKRKMQLSSGMGYDEIYASASLAQAFPSDAFDDSNNVQTTSGLFDVQYLLNSDGSINSCTLQIGTQQAQ